MVSEVIKEIPDLPKLEIKFPPVLVSKTGDKNLYTNLVNGKHSFNLEDVTDGEECQLISSAENTERGVSIQSFKDMIVLIFCRLDVSSVKYGIIKNWEPTHYVFIDKDKNICSYELYCGCHTISARWETIFRGLQSCAILINSFSMKRMCDMDYDSLKLFHDMFGDIVPVGNNDMIVLDSFSALDTFLQAHIKDGVKLNDFQNYVLDDVSLESFQFNENNIQKYAVIQRIEDSSTPTCVLRTFFKSSYGSIREGGRIYVTENGFFPCRFDGACLGTDSNASWKASDWHFPLQDFNKDLVKGTYLEYFSEIIDEIDVDDRCLAIWSFLSYPITEKLYKIPEMKDIMKLVFKLLKIKSNYVSPIDILRNIFGYIDETETDVFKFTKLNKYQFFKLIEIIKRKFPLFNIDFGLNGFEADSFIFYFKRILRDTSSYDNDTTDWAIDIIDSNLDNLLYAPIEDIYDIAFLPSSDFTKKIGFNACCKYSDKIFNITQLLGGLISMYGVHTAKKMSKMIVDNIWVTLCCDRSRYIHSINQKWRLSFYIVYRDFLGMVHDFGLQDRIKPYFSTFEELIDMHDTMVDYVNAYEDKIEAENWNKRKCYWDKFKYSGADFSIVIPKEPEDLATEGITLHHCVKSYIKKVSDGKTNVVFLRKNDDIDSPFYTIEIDNDDIVQQVHGMFNSNATPEIEDFVKNWGMAKKLTFSDYNKVR